MMTRRIPILAIAGLLALAPVARPPAAGAQSEAIMNSTPEQRAKVLTALMRAKLNLTDEQLPKIEAINLQFAQKMEPVIKGNDGLFAKRRAAQEIDQEKEAALKGALSSAQFTTYLAAKSDLKKKAEEQLE